MAENAGPAFGIGPLMIKIGIFFQNDAMSNKWTMSRIKGDFSEGDSKIYLSYCCLRPFFTVTLTVTNIQTSKYTNKQTNKQTNKDFI